MYLCSIMNKQLNPTSDKQRYIILDALRGFALLGICLANFPEFSLWSFLSQEEQMSMPTASTDTIVRFWQYFLIDAKFYAIFSMLFGIGFSIILSHAEERGSNGIRLFYKRMTALLCIAAVHLLLIWSGDILCLYAIVGMLLPLLRKLSNKQLLWVAGICWFSPVCLDLWQQLSGVSLSAPIVNLWWAKAHSYGITEENFASWLRDAKSYEGVHQFLMQGAIERMYEFVDGHRLLKVLGLFLIGYCIGRNKLYARLNEFRLPQVRLAAVLCLTTGCITSYFYSMSAVSGHPWGLATHSFLYATSALTMAWGYMLLFCLLWMKYPDGIMFRLLAKPGQMALTNYMCQSLMGILIYYGVGFGLGLSMGLWQVELTALAVFAVQILLSHLWMRHFRYGPLEWLWRMCTYGKRLPLRR